MNRIIYFAPIMMMKQKLVTPYIVCGQSGQADYKDLVGINARINRPGQGVFVLNEEYKAANKADWYDFYLQIERIIVSEC